MIRSRQTAELVAGAGVAAILTIGYIILVGRAVGPAEYADFSAALSAIYFIGLVMSPLTPTIARLTAQYRARNAGASVHGLRAQSIRHVATAGGILTAAALVASPFLAPALRFRTVTPLLLAFAAVLIYAFVSVDRGVVQGLLLFRVYNANIISEAAVRLALAIVLLIVSPTASAALVGYAVALAVAELVMAGRLRREWRDEGNAEVDWADVKRLAVPIVILMLAIAAFQNTDMLAVKRWFAPADAGAYGAATAIARGVGVVFAPFYVIAGPLLTSLHEAGKPVFGPALRLTLSFAGVVLIPLLALALLPRLILGSLYGPEFVTAASVVAPLAGVGIITFAGLMLGQALLTIHDFRFLAGYGFFAAVQVAGLALFHDSYGDVLRVLYVAQGLALLAVSGFFIHAWRRQVC